MEKTKYSHLDLDTSNDYVATAMPRDSETEGEEYEHSLDKRTEKSKGNMQETEMSSVTAWKRKEKIKTQKPTEREKTMCIKVSHRRIYRIFKFQ